MAVIDDLGLCVNVVVNGTVATEYDDPDPAQAPEGPSVPVVSKYIESKDDTEYEVTCRVLPQHSWLSTGKDNIISFSVYTDGIGRAARVYNQSDQARQSSKIIDGVRVRPHGASQEILNKFRFNAVTTVDEADDGSVKQDMQRAAQLGSIRVEVWRALNLGWDSSPESAVSGTHTNFSIAEKALKGRAVSHGTSLSAPISVPVLHRVRLEKLFGKPYAIFDFKYRSRDALRNEMIVPRTPSPDAIAGQLAGLSREDVQRLAEERLAQLKEEKKVKTTVKPEFDEIYDLTGDDQNDLGSLTKILRERNPPRDHRSYRRLNQSWSR